METEERRDKFKGKIKPIAYEYLEVNIFNDEYRKSMLHWDMMKILCIYKTHRIEYDRYEDAGLHLFLHNETQKITDYLNESIGLPVCVGRFQPTVSNRELDNLTNIFIDKIFNLIDECEYVKIEATKLKEPSRRMHRC